MISDPPARISRWKRLLTSALVIVSVSVITFLLERAGFLDRFETAGLDTFLRLKTPKQSPQVVIVKIDDEDYKALFRASSPLDQAKVQEIILAILEARPAVLGVDLDTSSWDPVRVRDLEIRKSRLPVKSAAVVWARETLGREGKLEPLPVLGNTKPVHATDIGIAALPYDQDGIIRHYRPVLETTEGPLPSFSHAMLEAYALRMSGKDTAKSGSGEHDHENLLLNFSGNPYEFNSLPASLVLQLRNGRAWTTSSPLKDKIVLLGGWYHAARDEYTTPVGVMFGVQLVAQAIQSELDGKIKPANERLMLLLEVLAGLVLVLINRYLPLGWALLISLLMLLSSLLFSSLVFFTVSRWANFVPVMIAVIIHQLYDHAQEYRRLYKMHQAIAAR